jgi:glutamate dehydrogenase/leucine dehydrogenase
VVNAGGIINIVEELDEYSPANARRRVRRIAATLGEIFDHAEKMSVTPLAAANLLARERLRA